MSFHHTSPESPSPDLSPSLSSVESLRLSLPESYQSLFDTLRKEVMDFCDFHHIPTSSLHHDETLRESTKHLSLPDLKHLSLLLVRLEYLVAHKKPIPPEQDPEFREAMEYAQEHYHIQEQYTSQVSLLEQVGILKDRHIKAIDGHSYPIPTLEQIVQRLYERRSELSTKHDQGFTKLLLVPFGMSLDTLQETLKRFLLDYKKKHPDFELDTKNPLWIWEEGYEEADTRTDSEGSPIMVYYPTSFDKVNHQGKTKAQILESQATNPDSFPGWTIHLLQPSTPKDPSSPGIAPIPRQGQGKTHGQDTDDPLDPSTPSRPDIEADKSPEGYLSPLHASQSNPDPPYSHETGLTPEDWILAFILHLQETGQPFDDVWAPSNTQSFCFLTGAFFPSSPVVPGACWIRDDRQVNLVGYVPDFRRGDGGSRFSVMI